MKSEILIAAAKITGILAAIMIIWKEITFSLYILPGYLPEDPTNISETLQVLKKGIKLFINSDNSYMLYPNLVIDFLQKQGSMIFILSLLCELWILYQKK